MPPEATSRARGAASGLGEGASYGWWPVELSERVVAAPMAAVSGEAELALFRGRDGVVRAFEDRCPHRRARLSIGAITEEGWLQCRYHGWGFDADTGRCIVIPNQPPDYKVPKPYAAARLDAAERHGLVFARLGGSGQGALEPIWPDIVDTPALRSDVAVVTMPHDLVVRALLETPKMLVHLDGLVFEIIVEREPHTASVRDDLVVVERYAQRKPRRVNYALAKSMLLLTTETQAVTGLTRLTLREDGGPVELDMLFAPSPTPPYATRLMWRVFKADGPGRALLRRWRMRGWLGHKPVAVALDEARSSGLPGFAGEPVRLWQALSAA